MAAFSANLGFLWADRPLPEAIRLAKNAGFDAVECHWPYDVPSHEVKAALLETGLPMIGLNTRRGDVSAGDFGLSCLPAREADARKVIDEAIEYAAVVGARAVHVMAGNSEGEAALACFIGNLHYACKLADKHGLNILIEPINADDVPGYFLRNSQQAVEIISKVAANNLKLMFDCYHVGKTEGDVIGTLKTVFPYIGHIQFASVPDRGAPDHGVVDYQTVFSAIAELGWDQPLGAEYKPTSGSDQNLGWMARF